jgi:hypothetical protein
MKRLLAMAGDNLLAAETMTETFSGIKQNNLISRQIPVDAF